jgi:hypothetical protein
MVKMNVNAYRNCSFYEVTRSCKSSKGYLSVEANMAFNTLLSSPLPTGLQLMLQASRQTLGTLSEINK